MTTYALSQNEGQVNFNPNTDLLNIDTTSSSNLFVTQFTGNIVDNGFDGPAVKIQDEFGDSITLIGVTERQLSFGINVTNTFDGTALVFGDNQVGTSGDDGPNLIQGTDISSREPNFFGPPGFFGSPGGDQIYGLGGADVIFAGAGGDVIKGGAGNDYIDAGTGNDFVLPGTGDDTVLGGDGDDIVNDDENAAGGGSDVMLGGAGNDTLNAGLNGDDRLVGGDGNDVIYGSRGSNLLEGDAGNDTITVGFTALAYGGFVEHSGGSDTILGGDGNDTIQVSADVSQTFGGDGNDTIETSVYGFNGSNYANGGAGNDIIFDDGSTSSNLFYGLDGNDVLGGSGGNDSLFGGDGNDRLFTDDSGLTDEHGNFVFGFSNSGGNDLLAGGMGNDSYYLGYGNDLVADIGGGNDAINPGSGSGFGGGNDTIYAGDGDDTINANGSTNLVFGQSGNDYVQIYGGRDSNDVFGSNSTVSGGDGDDTIRAASASSTEANLFYGDAGNDLLSGGQGNDNLFGGTGDDRINFSAFSFGSVFVPVGGAGGNDVLSGGDGNDSILATGDFNLVYGGTGDDLIAAASLGQSSLFGSEGNDSVFGSTLDDVLGGGSGNDNLLGGAGDDFILGGSGNDFLVGDNGTGDGATGADTFAFNQGDTNYLQGGSTTGAVDDIFDFVTGTDKITFMGLPAGDAATYTETSSTAAVDLQSAELVAGAVPLGASTTYVFVAGANDGFLFVNENSNPGFEDAIILTGLNSTAAFDASDII